MKDKKSIHLASVLSASLGCFLSFGVYVWDDGSSPILYWGIMPGLPFILVSLWALLHKGTSSSLQITGASIACLSITILAYGSILYESITYSGGGANIGLGIILLPLPLYYLIAARIGWNLGGRFAPKT